MMKIMIFFTSVDSDSPENVSSPWPADNAPFSCGSEKDGCKVYRFDPLDSNTFYAKNEWQFNGLKGKIEEIVDQDKKGKFIVFIHCTEGHSEIKTLLKYFLDKEEIVFCLYGTTENTHWSDIEGIAKKNELKIFNLLWNKIWPKDIIFSLYQLRCRLLEPLVAAEFLSQINDVKDRKRREVALKKLANTIEQTDIEELCTKLEQLAGDINLTELCFPNIWENFYAKILDSKDLPEVSPLVIEFNEIIHYSRTAS